MLAGLLLSLAFLPGPFAWLAWFGFVPLLDAMHARLQARSRGGALFRLGYLFGFVFFAIGMHWVARLSPVAITVPWLRYPAWLAAAAYLALYPACATWIAGMASRQSGLSVAVTFPVSMLLLETLRASGELGFPWFQPGYSQAAFPPLLQMASLGGVGLVTLWLLVLNALLWRAITARARLRTATGALLCFLLPWAWGMRVLDAAPREGGPVVALVQPDIAGEIKWSGTHDAEILDTFLRLSAEALADTASPRLLVWPETATGTYLLKRPEQTLAIARLTAQANVPLFAGYADWEMGANGKPRMFNAAGLLGPGSAAGPRYAKRHLVPFGERMPFQWLLPALGSIELGQAEWAAGDRPIVYEAAGIRFAPLICFESIFPELARDDVRRGAQALAVITNDEWFGNSAALPQHAAMAQFRAVENHVPLMRCANTGLTMLIDSNGRVTRRLPAFRPGVLIGALSRPGPRSLYARAGDWPAWLALWALLAMVLVPARAWRHALALTARAGAA